MAVRLGVAAGLRNAATCEFLLDPDGAFWFLEVNTRLQVEHGVTELVAGVDIVREQFLVAGGAPLSEAVVAAGARAAHPVSHAIEVRIAAEDPSRAFAPTPGRVGRWVMPSGPGVRVDTAIESGDVVPPDYDNLIAKVMVHAQDRDAAIDALRRALDETEIGGIQTTLPFHRFVARSESFRRGDVSTGWVDANWDGEAARRDAVRHALVAAGLAALGDRDGASTRDGPVSGTIVETGAPIAANPPTTARDGGVAGRGATAGDRPMAGLTPPGPVDGVRARLASTSRTGDEPEIRIGVLAQRHLLVDGEPSVIVLHDRGGGRHLLDADGERWRGPGHPRAGPERRPGGGPPGGPRRWVQVRGGGRVGATSGPARAGDPREAGRRGGRAARGPGPHPGQGGVARGGAGDTVTAGQQLLVVEAMKMQNELRAPRGGTIGQLGVAQGVNIEVGDLLLVIS